MGKLSKASADKTRSIFFIIFFPFIFLANSAAADNLRVTFSYYMVRNAQVIKEIKLLNQTYAEAEKKAKQDEREDLKYEYYADMLRALKGVKPIFVRATEAGNRNEVLDFAVIKDKELHLSYNLGAIEENKITLKIYARYDKRTLYQGGPLTARLNSPFMLTQSGPYWRGKGRFFMKILYLQVHK